jgi:hypothetical protein
MAKRKPTDIIQLRLRLPDRLRQQIEKEAKARESSLNREMVRRLEASFDNENLQAIIQSAIDAAFARQKGTEQ